MLKRFTWEEFPAHLTSGRIASRPDPVTWGCWQYKDMFSWSGEVQVARGKKWQSGGEYEPGAEHLEQFDRLYNHEAGHMGAEMLADSAGKGLGKDNLGKGKGLGKGKALGNVKGKSLLALEDKDKDENEKPPPRPTEEEELKEAIKKARRARDQTASAQSDLEEALEKAKPSLSRQGKAAAEGWNAELGKVFHSLKECLSGKKKVNSAQVKKLLEEAGKTIKGAKDEAKELRHLANRAPSAASKRSRG